MLMMVPRVGRVRRPDHRGARHRGPPSCRRPSRCAEVAEPGTLRLRARRVHLSRRRRAGGARRLLRGAARPDRRRSSARPAPARARWSTWSRGCSTSPAAGCWSTGSTYAGSIRTCSGRDDRSGAAAGLAVLRARCAPTCLRPARRHRGGAVARARGRPGPRLRRGDARGARRPGLPGRHQPQRRAAPAARDRAGAGPPAARSTSSTTRSARSTWPPMPGCAPRCGR